MKTKYWLIPCLMIVMFLTITPVLAQSTVKIVGNAITFQDEEYTMTIPFYSIVSIGMKRQSKVYKMQYYGYKADRARNIEITKESYELVRRILMRSEQ